MARNEFGAPTPSAAPLTREQVLPIAARIYAASLNGRLPELDSSKADRQIAIMQAIELAREVDPQLREES